MNVCKVLVADDEPKIRRGLRAAVEALGAAWQVVGEAEDGEMALELATAARPDILLVDIRMPRLNGLELVERLAAVSSDWLVIIVTGHDEFDFARQALKLRVFDYLLKPVAAPAFAAVLEAARAELAARRQADQFLEWSRDQLEAHLPDLRESFLRKLVAGSLSRSELTEHLEFLRLRLPDECHLMTFHLVERMLGPGSGRESYRRLMILTLKNLVTDAVGHCLGSRSRGTGNAAGGNGQGLGAWRHDTSRSSLPLVFEDESETIVALLPLLAPEGLQAIQSEVEVRAGDTLHHIPSIATGTAGGGPEGLAEAFDQLGAELLVRGNSESFIQLIQNYLELHYRQPDLTLEEVAAEIQLSPGYLSRILKQKTGFSFVDYLTRLRVKKATQLMADPAARVFEVAERVGYHSQQYFSRAFKKVLGISPSEYRRGGSE